MENGYNVFWTSNALNELEETIQYLQHHFSDKEIKKLAVKIENFAEIISQNPFVFPKAGNKNIHKAVILNSIPYITVYLGKMLRFCRFSQTDSLRTKKD